MYDGETPTLEERVTKLEQEMKEIRQKIALKPIIESDIPWWERIYGASAGSEEFLSAMRAGREYRESSRDPRDKDIDESTA